MKYDFSGNVFRGLIFPNQEVAKNFTSHFLLHNNLALIIFHSLSS
jgi:hypothetical protein